jgi:hypothetical protein
MSPSERQARELDETREQKAATCEVLRVISSAPSNLKPVFAPILENAVRIRRPILELSRAGTRAPYILLQRIILHRGSLNFASVTHPSRRKRVIQVADFARPSVTEAINDDRIEEDCTPSN